MYSVYSSVELTGPPVPALTTYDWVKVWKAWIICNTRLKRITGLSSGMVMFRNLVQGPAPSTAAASYRSCGIWRSPARKMIIGEPNVHTWSKISVSRAYSGVAVHAGRLVKPGPANPWLTSPDEPNICRHNRAMATLEPSSDRNE